jgi:hypothetical protein
VYLNNGTSTTETTTETTTVEVITGACGDNATYSYSDGKLTIDGTGAISTTPWSGIADKITSVEVGDNITAIADNAFSGLTNASEILLSAGVTEIGDNAFNGCTSLESIAVPDTVTSVSAIAFNGLSDNAVIYNYSDTDITSNAKVVKSQFTYGDLSCDDLLAADDSAVLLQKVLDDSYKTTIERLTKDYMLYADVSNDGILAADDAAQILQKVLDDTRKFTVEE